MTVFPATTQASLSSLRAVCVCVAVWSNTWVSSCWKHDLLHTWHHFPRRRRKQKYVFLQRKMTKIIVTPSLHVNKVRIRVKVRWTKSPRNERELIPLCVCVCVCVCVCMYVCMYICVFVWVSVWYGFRWWQPMRLSNLIWLLVWKY